MVAAHLAAALRAGVRLDYSGDPQRPVFRVPRAQRSLVTVLLEPGNRAETQRVLGLVAAYRAVLLRLFALAAAGAGAEVERQAQAAVQEEMRLHDELGPALAALILSATEHEYVAATGSCAYCGGQH
jgi:hypothetical protein